MVEYKTTANKDTVRRYDKQKIEDLYLKKDKKLKYIGLPSPELNDIVEWNEFLDSFVAIERGEKFDRVTGPHNLLLRATILNLMDKLTLIRGELDDVLMAGKKYGGFNIEYPFDVAFFDFFGGILNKDYNRTKSIKTFFRNQVPNDFLLLMTFNLRYANECEELYVIDKIEKELNGLIKNQVTKKKLIEVLNWCKSKEVPEQYRQKIFVPYLLREAESSGYKVFSEEPIYYLGYNNSPMIHFVSWFNYEGSHTTRAVSDQTLLDVIDLNLKTVQDEFIVKCDLQSPKIS
ncbi:MAG: hypothetical protein KAT05_15565 [Spirochaetes bacterium]|nr:hypothetical protein [Spirochaetota bacterium]